MFLEICQYLREWYIKEPYNANMVRPRDVSCIRHT